MAKFIELVAVKETGTPGYFVATIVADFGGHSPETIEFGVSPSDYHGLSSEVRDAVTDWINDRRPVQPHRPPTADEMRQFMPPITRRQLLRVLLEIGLNEPKVDEMLQNDPVGMIEWRNANTFSRVHPLIISVASDLNLPPEQVDSLWGFALSF